MDFGLSKDAGTFLKLGVFAFRRSSRGAVNVAVDRSLLLAQIGDCYLVFGVVSGRTAGKCGQVVRPNGTC